MNATLLSDWMFSISEAPIQAIVSGSGGKILVPVPNRKALVNEQTGRVLGVVGKDYLVITNARALELAREVAERAFPGVEGAEWQVGRACGPATRSYVHLDLMHPTHVMNLWDNEEGPSEIYTPFLRVTNSYNRARALRFDFGYMRMHCSNGVVFEEEVASLRAAHTRRDVKQLTIDVEEVRFEGIGDRFTAMVRDIRAIELGEDESLKAARQLLAWPVRRPKDPEPRREEVARLDRDLSQRHTKYRHELGPNAYALFNTMTDIAARPPKSSLFRRDRATIERSAGRWLKQLSEASLKPDFHFGEHIDLLRRSSSRSRDNPIQASRNGS